MIPSIGLNLIEHVYVLVELVFSAPVLFGVHVELISIHVQIFIPFDTFKKHLPKTFFRLKVGEMMINETLDHVWIQNLCIVGWTIIEEKQHGFE